MFLNQNQVEVSIRGLPRHQGILYLEVSTIGIRLSSFISFEEGYKNYDKGRCSCTSKLTWHCLSFTHRCGTKAKMNMFIEIKRFSLVVNRNLGVYGEGCINSSFSQLILNMAMLLRLSIFKVTQMCVQQSLTHTIKEVQLSRKLKKHITLLFNLRGFQLKNCLNIPVKVKRKLKHRGRQLNFLLNIPVNVKLGYLNRSTSKKFKLPKWYLSNTRERLKRLSRLSISKFSRRSHTSSQTNISHNRVALKFGQKIKIMPPKQKNKKNKRSHKELSPARMSSKDSTSSHNQDDLSQDETEMVQARIDGNNLHLRTVKRPNLNSTANYGHYDIPAPGLDVPSFVLSEEEVQTTPMHVPGHEVNGKVIKTAKRILKDPEQDHMDRQHEGMDQEQDHMDQQHVDTDPEQDHMDQQHGGMVEPQQTYLTLDQLSESLRQIENYSEISLKPKNVDVLPYTNDDLQKELLNAGYSAQQLGKMGILTPQQSKLHVSIPLQPLITVPNLQQNARDSTPSTEPSTSAQPQSDKPINMLVKARQGALSVNQMEYLTMFIERQYLQAKRAYPNCGFKFAGYTKADERFGHLVVPCNTNEMCIWLQRVAETSSLKVGAPVEAVLASSQPRVSYFFYINGYYTEIVDVLGLFEVDNPGLDTSSWRIMKTEAVGKESKLVVSMNLESSEFIKSKNFRLAYGLKGNRIFHPLLRQNEVAKAPITFVGKRKFRVKFLKSYFKNYKIFMKCFTGGLKTTCSQASISVGSLKLTYKSPLQKYVIITKIYLYKNLQFYLNTKSININLFEFTRIVICLKNHTHAYTYTKLSHIQLVIYIYMNLQINLYNIYIYTNLHELKNLLKSYLIIYIDINIHEFTNIVNWNNAYTTLKHIHTLIYIYMYLQINIYIYTNLLKLTNLLKRSKNYYTFKNPILYTKSYTHFLIIKFTLFTLNVLIYKQLQIQTILNIHKLFNIQFYMEFYLIKLEIYFIFTLIKWLQARG